MTPIIVTEIIGIEIAMAKIILTGAGDGMATGDRMIVIEAKVDDGINMINIPNKTTRKHYPPPNHYRPPPMGRQYQYQMPYEQYPPYPQQHHQYTQRLPAQSRQATRYMPAVSKPRPL